MNPIEALVLELVKQSAETEWLEFKHNNCESAEKIGQYISALSNTATLYERDCAYLIWGVANETHDIVGTSFDRYTAKGKGQELLENYLIRFLSKNASYRFDDALGLNF